MFLATSWPHHAWPPLSAGIVQAREDRRSHLGIGASHWILFLRPASWGFWRSPSARMKDKQKNLCLGPWVPGS